MKNLESFSRNKLLKNISTSQSHIDNHQSNPIYIYISNILLREIHLIPRNRYPESNTESTPRTESRSPFWKSTPFPDPQAHRGSRRSLVYGQEIVGSFTTRCAAWPTLWDKWRRLSRERASKGKIKRNIIRREREREREGKEDGMKTSIAGACNTAVRTEGSGGAINQAAWKMPDQGRDVSAKTVWNRYSRGSRRTWIKRESGGWRKGREREELLTNLHTVLSASNRGTKQGWCLKTDFEIGDERDKWK